MNLFRLLGAIPIPRFSNPPANPVSQTDKALANRINPSAGWTNGNHVAANLSDIFHGYVDGIGPKDMICRDEKNRFTGYVRRKK